MEEIPAAFGFFILGGAFGGMFATIFICAVIAGLRTDLEVRIVDQSNLSADGDIVGGNKSERA